MMTLEGAADTLALEGAADTLALEGAADTLAFEAFVEQVLCPTLQRGQIVVLDNLSIHKSCRTRELAAPESWPHQRVGRTRELIEGCGCELWFLPTYSPDLNPIEQAC
jgi:transposase